MAPDSTFILSNLLIIFGKKVCFCRQGTRTCVAGWNGECTTLQWSLCASTVLLRFREMFRAKHRLVHMLWTLVWHLDPTHLKWKHPYDLAWSCTWPLCVTYDNMIPPASSKLFGQGSPCGHYLFKPYSAGDHRSLQAKTVTVGSTRNSPLTLHLKLSREKKKEQPAAKVSKFVNKRKLLWNRINQQPK